MKKISVITVLLLASTVKGQPVDIYGPQSFIEILNNTFNIAWTPAAITSIDNLRYIVLMDAPATNVVMLDHSDRSALKMNNKDSINTGTYGSLLRGIFQIVDINTDDSGALADKFILRPLLHSYNAGNYSSDSLIISDAGSFYVSESDSNGYLVFEFVGTPSSVNIKASSRVFYNSVSDTLEELTNWTTKWLKIQGSAVLFTNSQVDASDFFMADARDLINLEIAPGSDFNPLSTEWQDNAFAAYPNDVWEYEFSQFYQQFLMDVDPVYQYQFGANTAADDSAYAKLLAIESSLASQGEALRYDKSVYIAFRNSLLAQKFASTDLYNGRYGESTVPYVYFTNETDENGIYHPFMVIASHNASAGPNFLIDVARPPGDGTNPYESGTITRNAVLEHKLVKIPLKDYGLITSLEDNNLAPYGSLAADMGLISGDFNVYNYASVASNGIAVDGVVIYPAFNNNLRYAANDAEITSTGIHVGRGMGLHYHADGHSYSNNGLNLYNIADYPAHNHPPLIGFAYDGIALFGKYESSYPAMTGYNDTLDEFGGHDHDGLGYHYHAFSDTYFADSLGTPTGPYVQHFLLAGAWKGNINDIPGFLQVSTSQLMVDSIAPYAGGMANVGIDKINNYPGEVLIYPNPNKGTFTVRLPEPGLSSLILYDSKGKIIKVIQISSTDNSFNFTNLSKGLYFIKGRNEYHSFVRKVIIE